MSQTNTKRPVSTRRTYEGAKARHTNPLERLRSVLFAHMLHEDTFYVDGESNRDILIAAVDEAVMFSEAQTRQIILQARTDMNIRHASLLAAVEYVHMSNGGPDAIQLIYDVIQRVDELAEVCAMGARVGTVGVPGKAVGLPSAIRKGVARAFSKFDEYQFGKYKGKGRSVSLRDAVFLTHPSPAKYPLVQKIVDDTLEIPNTWEVRLSSGEDKRFVFTDLLSRNQLGALALLRNLRNMHDAGVDRALVAHALREANWSRVLPFRFMSAVLSAPVYAKELDEAFLKAVAGSTHLPGKTAVMVDTSASMSTPISAKSMVRSYWAGAVLASAVNGDHVDLYQWASRTMQVPNFRSLSSMITLSSGQVGHGTDLGQAMRSVGGGYDRYIVITDMQFSDRVSPVLPKGAEGFIINTSPYDKQGLAIGNWTYLNGWSDQVLRYIGERG